jgi:hypothetical protein
MTWPDLYLQHFTRYFGKPFDVQVYSAEDGSAIRLATFDQRYYPKFLVYASLGLSEHADDLGDVGEMILLSDDKTKDVPLIFVNSLLFIMRRKIPLVKPFSVGGIELVRPEFVEYYGKAAIYYSLAAGFPPNFERVQRLGDVGHVYQGLFISWAEQDFLNRNGPAAFEEKLHAHKYDPCSLRRPSCV